MNPDPDRLKTRLEAMDLRLVIVEDHAEKAFELAQGGFDLVRVIWGSATVSVLFFGGASILGRQDLAKLWLAVAGACMTVVGLLLQLVRRTERRRRSKLLERSRLNSRP